MKKIKQVLILTLAVLLALGLVACGDKENTEDDVATNEDDGIVIEYDLDVISSNLDESYYGLMETGEQIGFGTNSDGSFSMMIFMSDTEHVTFVGPATMNGNQVTITDDVNGLQLTFEVLAAEEGGIVIDLGDLGGGILVVCEKDELLALLTEAIEKTVAVG